MRTQRLGQEKRKRLLELTTYSCQLHRTKAESQVMQHFSSGAEAELFLTK
jgi:hypothetical protein